MKEETKIGLLMMFGGIMIMCGSFYLGANAIAPNVSKNFILIFRI